MPGLDYAQYVTQISQMAVVDPADANFQAILPMMIDYASNRIARDLDMIFTSVSLSGADYKLVAGNRNISFSQNLPDGSSFMVSEQINLILPSGSNPDAATRVPLLATTKEFLDAVYGSSLAANLGQPKYYAPFNETPLLVGPVPDQNYFVEVVGTVRPPPLGYPQTVTSATAAGVVGTITFAYPHNILTGNTVTVTGFSPTLWNGTFIATMISPTVIQIPVSPSTTSASTIGKVVGGTSLISQYWPDLMVMASMIYISAYQRNFGKESDDPQMAQSYEGQYQLLLKSAMEEEDRKKYSAAAWSSQSTAKFATPTRG